MRQLSTLLAETPLAIDGEVFVLYDQRFILAHRRLANGFKSTSPEHPLPTVEEFGDQVLMAYLHPELARNMAVGCPVTWASGSLARRTGRPIP